jgi:hypothetical protein
MMSLVTSMQIFCLVNILTMDNISMRGLLWQVVSQAYSYTKKIAFNVLLATINQPQPHVLCVIHYQR